MKAEFNVRTMAKPSDLETVREIVESTNFFHDYEVDVAVELVQENLSKGHVSGYNFLFADLDGKTIAFSCYGLIPCTASSFDLYWIVVHNKYRKEGIGRKLLALTEDAANNMGAHAIYAETSSQTLYEPTRRFYLSNGYQEVARLKNFYKAGDDKVIYSKILQADS